jgi:hypothetical protein
MWEGPLRPDQNPRKQSAHKGPSHICVSLPRPRFSFLAVIVCALIGKLAQSILTQ